MILQKPAHIKDEIWLQHLNWMKLMSAGQITKDPSLRAREQSKKKV
ncbi:MAG: hypothetical protein HRU20_04515 [Pseudomonadales bacterium]|nr:hypothetical protein [Pseudomonadales bacterium]